MSSSEDLMSDLGAVDDTRHAEIMASLGRIEAALASSPTPVPPIPPNPVPSTRCLSGVYTGANQSSGNAEKAFGDWRGKPVEKVLAFTPDDSWSMSWWLSIFGGSFPYKDRLYVTRGLCLKNETVDSPLTDPQCFAKWGAGVHAAGITKPIFRLGHEANGGWYAWKIKGHEQTWATRFELASKQIKQACPDATIMFCLAAGQPTTGFRMPAKEFVDAYGVDLYDVGNQIGDWDKHKAIAANYGVPLSVPEWGLWANDGSGGHGDNPDYIAKMHELTTRDCGNGGDECYFNKNSSSTHVLSSYPKSEAKYKELFGG